jgi:hypothetical protein
MLHFLIHNEVTRSGRINYCLMFHAKGGLPSAISTPTPRYIDQEDLLSGRGTLDMGGSEFGFESFGVEHTTTRQYKCAVVGVLRLLEGLKFYANKKAHPWFRNT